MTSVSIKYMSVEVCVSRIILVAQEIGVFANIWHVGQHLGQRTSPRARQHGAQNFAVLLFRTALMPRSASLQGGDQIIRQIAYYELGHEIALPRWMLSMISYPSRTLIVTVVALALQAGALHAADATKPKYRSVGDITAAAPDSDWRTPDPANLLYLELATGRVIIELAPQFAPEHVDNIRTLAKAHFWDGTSIYRAQDNFVVQFGDIDADDPQHARPLGQAKKHLPAEFHRPLQGLAFDKLPDVDGWAKEVGFVEGFPVGRDPAKGIAWLAHCYGTVGAGRSDADDSSIGTELYVTIGQSPRQLDDNITVVGRVLSGMELLSTIRRGPPPLGFYEEPRERTSIRSIRLASEIPAAQRTPLQVMRTNTRSFRDVTEARRNRVDGFYKRPAGHVDLCNAAIPTRTPPAGGKR